jgi:hypothetical protein
MNVEASAAKPAVRTVAHGFEPWVTRSCSAFVSAPWRARESFLSPAKAGSQNARTLDYPRLEAVGYGSYAGYADEVR